MPPLLAAQVDSPTIMPLVSACCREDGSQEVIPSSQVRWKEKEDLDFCLDSRQKLVEKLFLEEKKRVDGTWVINRSFLFGLFFSVCFICLFWITFGLMRVRALRDWIQYNLQRKLSLHLSFELQFPRQSYCFYKFFDFIIHGWQNSDFFNWLAETTHKRFHFALITHKNENNNQSTRSS